MRDSSSFFTGFLDGFTMSGFVSKLSPPGGPIFAPEWTEEVLAMNQEELRAIPEDEFQKVMLVLNREAQSRQAAPANGTAYGVRQ